MTKQNIIKLQEIIHPILLKMFSMKTPGKMIVDGTIPSYGTYLIVANHFCIQDIPQLGQAVKKHFYLLVSDEDKNTVDGLGLMLNGVEWVHRTDKNSRRNANEKIIELLKKGKNFAMYPEATWNLSPNLLMLPMNYGCIRTALEANVPIIPVVTFFADDVRHTKIGDIFIPNDNLEESIDLLRDTMSTMLFLEIEEYYKRNYGIDSNIQREFIDNIVTYYEMRSTIDNNYWYDYVDMLYDKYDRARKDKKGVREFESQFIFTSKTDDYSFFQEFNSIVREMNNGLKIKRISSENNGYMGEEYRDYFGLGYNTHVLKKELKK